MGGAASRRWAGCRAQQLDGGTARAAEGRATQPAARGVGSCYRQQRAPQPPNLCELQQCSITLGSYIGLTTLCNHFMPMQPLCTISHLLLKHNHLRTGCLHESLQIQVWQLENQQEGAARQGVARQTPGHLTWSTRWFAQQYEHSAVILRDAPLCPCRPTRLGPVESER